MSCSRCQQVVEIATLQEHLLDECERRADFAACPTCGDALEAGAKFEAHVAAQSCKPQPAAGSGKQRCVSAQGAPQVRSLACARVRALPLALTAFRSLLPPSTRRAASSRFATQTLRPRRRGGWRTCSSTAASTTRATTGGA